MILDRDALFYNIVGDRDERSNEFDHVPAAIDEAISSIAGLLRRKAGEYEDNRLLTAAKALKQFANELEN